MARSPLIDRYDPYGILQREAERGRLRGREYGDDRDLTIADLLKPEEKKGMLRSLAEMGASGLAGAGWILDLPGALVRGTLSGDPLSAFGTFDERVDGRELMRQYGLLDDSAEDSWGNFTAGMVGEIILDPLSYIAPGASTFGKGAATKAMKALDASGASRFAKQYADELGVGMRELYRTRTADDFLKHLGGLDLPEGAAKQLEKDARGTFAQQYKRFGGTAPLDEALQETLAKDLSIGIPGTNINTAFDLPFIGGLPAKVGDTVAKFATENPYLGPATTRLSALFNTDSGGFYIPGDLEGTLAGQKLSRKKVRDSTLGAEYLIGGDGQFDDKLIRAKTSPLVNDLGEVIPVNDIEIQRAINDFVEDPAYFAVQSGKNPVYKAVSQNKEYMDLANFVKDLGPRLRKMTEDAGGDAAEFLSNNWTRTGNLDAEGKLTGLGYIPRQSQSFNKAMLPEGIRKKPGAYARQSKIFGQGVKGRKPELDLPQWLMRKFTTEKKFGDMGSEYLQDVLGDSLGFGEINNKAAREEINKAYRSTMRDAFGVEPEVKTLYGDNLGNFLKSDEYKAAQVLDEENFNRNFDLALEAKPKLSNAEAQRVARNAAKFKEIVPNIDFRAVDKSRGMLRAKNAEIKEFYRDMAERLLNLDLQYKEGGVGLFDSPVMDNIRSRLKIGAADVGSLNAIYDLLGKEVGRGLRQTKADSAPIGFDPFIGATGSLGLANKSKRMNELLGKFTSKGQKKIQRTPGKASIDKKLLDALTTLQPQTTVREPITGLGGLYRQFTNAFKVGALGNPAFLVRNLYSGLANNAALGAGNVRDFIAARGGGTKQRIVDRLRDSIPYRGLSDDEIFFKFAREAAAQDLLGGNVVSDLAGIANKESRALPGLDKEPVNMLGNLKEGLKPSNFFGLRGVRGLRNPKPLRENTNPLLQAIDAGNEWVEDTLRLGTFLNQARKGVAPGVAGDLSRMANVDYRPEAFTRFENDYIKQLIPFYSFQRGILPSIANNMVYRPGGVMGQSIRAVNRASQPTEENFVPEYLRKSAAIPLPAAYGGAEGLQRYLTNIDLPWEGTFDLLTQGGSLSDTAAKTLANIAGQSNPLIKFGIESATGKQLYTGKNLRDTFSSLEKQFGPGYRPLENFIRNIVPFGSKGMSIFQGITDDRLTPQQRAIKLLVNNALGVKLSDVDPELARSRAARDMLNEILQGTPGTRVYENISVPEEALDTMSPEQQRLYLLYRTIQSEAQKKARERKKLEAQSLLNPLAGAR